MKAKIIYIILSLFVSISCSKNDDNSIIEETIHVRNGKADMPVHIYGNISSNVIILIVHGGPGGNGLEYRTGLWAENMEQSYAFAYWDQRGQGMSQGHLEESDLNIGIMVEDLDAVVKSLKAKFGNTTAVFVLGHSWGGTLTAQYMVTGDLQSSIEGWIEVDGAHDNPKLYIEATKMFMEVATEQIALGNNVENWTEIQAWAAGIDTNKISYDNTVDLNKKAYDVEDWLQEDGVLESYERGGYRNSIFFGPVTPFTSFLTGTQTNKFIEDEVEAIALTNQLHNINIPVLVMWGKYDFVVPPSLGYDTYNLISSNSKEIVIFEKSGHSPMYNEWEKFVSELKSFIEANK